MDIDTSEWVGSSSEAPSEKSERQKESAKKAQKELQKTQKDEQKAKWDNSALFHILSRFIQNPLYEELIPTVIGLLEHAYPSRYILATISLFYPEATEHILKQSGKSDHITKLIHLPRSEFQTPFDDTTLDHSIRDWISFWVDFSRQFLREKEGSTILSQKLAWLLSWKNTRTHADEAVARFFAFFLSLRNVTIKPNIAHTYAVFITDEYQKTLEKALEEADISLRWEPMIDVNSLFGMGQDPDKMN